MKDISESRVNTFLNKFDKLLSFLLTQKGKKFSKDASLYLEKALDHMKVIDDSNTADDTHSALIEIVAGKQFFAETLRATNASSTPLPVLTFSIKVLSKLSDSEPRFQKSLSEFPETFVQIHENISTTFAEQAEVKQSLLHLFLSLSKFHRGRDWIWNHGLLRFVTQCLDDRAFFVKQAAQELTQQILFSSTANQRREIFERLQISMRGHESQFNSQQNQSDRLETYFSVLENYIEKNLAENNTDNSAIELVSLNIEEFLMNLAQSSTNQRFLGKVCSFMVSIYAKCASEKATENSIWKKKTLEIIQLVLKKKLMQATLVTVSKSLFYWSYLRDETEFQLDLLHIMVT